MRRIIVLAAIVIISCKAVSSIKPPAPSIAPPTSIAYPTAAPPTATQIPEATSTPVPHPDFDVVLHPDGPLYIGDRVSFEVYKGRILAIVGESGSGKSVTALSTMKLVPIPPGKYMSGKIIMDGEDILTVSEKRLQEIRGKQISMIFQNPRAALNPSFTIQ